MAELLDIMCSTGEVAPVQAMMTSGGGAGLATLIINLDTRWTWMVKFMFPPLHPRDSHRYVLNTNLAGPHSLSECCRDGRKVTNEIYKLRCHFENGFLLIHRSRGLFYAYLLQTPSQQTQPAVKFILKISTLVFLRQCHGSQHKVHLQEYSSRTDELHQA